MQNTSELPILPVKFDDLLKWFIAYKERHPFKEKNALRKFLDSFSKKDIPVTFILKFIECRSAYYNLIFNINKFQQIYTELTCPMCGMCFIYPYFYVKHIVACRKSKEKNNPNSTTHRHHHHHHHHHH